MQSIPEFPSPDAADTEEVAWALCTAAALWRRGDFADGVAWLRKAASLAAKEQPGGAADSNVRVVALTIAANDLARYVEQWTKGNNEHPSSIRVSQEYADAPIELSAADLQSLHSLDSIPLPPRNNALCTTLPQDARKPAGLDAPKPAAVVPLPPRNAGPSQTLPDGTVNPLYATPLVIPDGGQRPTDVPITPLVIDFGPSIRTQPASAPTSSDPFASFDLAASSSDPQPTPKVSEGTALSLAERAGVPTTKKIPSDADYPPKEAVPSRPESVPTRRADLEEQIAAEKATKGDK